MVCSRHTLPSWLTAASRVDFDSGAAAAAANVSMPDSVFADGLDSSHHHHHSSKPLSSDFNMGFAERAFSAAGAAVLSAILVNPLDVAKVFSLLLKVFCWHLLRPLVFLWKHRKTLGKTMNEDGEVIGPPLLWYLYSIQSATRLQAQAAGVPYSHSHQQMSGRMASIGPSTIFSDARCSPSCTRGVMLGTEPFCPPECFRYKGTMDEGVARLWRGTNAALALAIPTVGIYLPCYDIFRNWIEEFTGHNAPGLTPYAPLVAGTLARSLACICCSPIELARTRMQVFMHTNTNFLIPLPLPQQGYRILWTGVGAQLARDVPFSAICWSTLEPIRRKLFGLVGEEANAATVLGANFSAGFVAGSLAAAATCPLDVAKTRRQIEVCS
ncbi:hypothetical protein ACLOJK_014461 [Asimina triloba]